jgi:tetratricopeptide (TPR) repeat protein
MATKTKRPVTRRSAGIKTTKSSGKALQARRNHRAGSNSRPKGIAGIPGSRSRIAAGKPLTKKEMPVDEKHVAAVHSFELGLQQVQRQNYRKAREIFEKLVATAPADVADRARVHLKACIDRLGAAAGPAPKTANDYQVLGVAELNVGNLDRALEHLNQAQKLEPQREEIRYALAAAYSRKGDRDAALEHLKASITLRPENRFQARHDPDFEAIAGDEGFQALLSQNGLSTPGGAA